MTFIQRTILTSRSHMFQASWASIPRQSLAAQSIVGRHFSAGSAREKLQTILEDYRSKHYTQELRSRFAKELTKAADIDKDGFISVDEVEKLLENIGAKDGMSREEVSLVMDDIGSKEGEKGVPVKDVVNYLLNKS